jgi:hypothetical protein
MPVAVKDGALFPPSLFQSIGWICRQWTLLRSRRPRTRQMRTLIRTAAGNFLGRIYSQSFARAPVHTRLGPRAGLGTSSGGPMDTLALTCPKVAELAAHGSSPPAGSVARASALVLGSGAVDSGPIDAPSLPNALVLGSRLPQAQWNAPCFPCWRHLQRFQFNCIGWTI